jgi:chromosomal replication initiation ATPase DnaA
MIGGQCLDGYIEHEIRAVCALTGVDPKLLFTARKTSAISRTRALIWRELRERHGLSYPQLGRIFGKHHTTVLMAIKKLKNGN